MKNLYDIISESLLDDEDEIVDKAKWSLAFKNSKVADETLELVENVIEKLKCKRVRYTTDNWSIQPYRGFYTREGRTHAIDIERTGEHYTVLWKSDPNKVNDNILCRKTRNDRVIEGNYFELPKELEWIIYIIKSCPKIKKI
jgi:hypothetical protein